MLTFHRMCLQAFLAAILGFGSSLSADDSPFSKGQEDASSAKTEEPDIKKLSEAFGHFIGRNLKSSGLNFDLEGFIKGIRDGEAGKPAPMSDQEYEQQMLILQEKAFKKLSEDNLKSAEEFLKKNSSEKGVVQIVPEKLQYIILKEGTGPAVTEHSTPKIQYTGKYLDGTVFGSSQDTGGPITIPLDQTIPGFSRGLIGMKEGEKRKLFVHPDLGYGKSGHLPPNSLLIFEVEVLEANSSDSASLELDEEDISEIYPEGKDHSSAKNDDDNSEDEGASSNPDKQK